MDFCISAGVIGWYEHMGLEEINWSSGSLLSFAESIHFSSMQDSLNVMASDTMT